MAVVVCQFTSIAFAVRGIVARTHAMPLPGPLSPPPSSPFLPPRLLRARASESGSIFQESVWPPPAALMVPSHHPQSVNLARIVTDVMGPPDADPLLLLPPGSLRDRGQEQEQEQGVLEPEGEGEGERPSAMIPSSSPLALTNPDDLSPRSDLQSPSPPSTPPPLEREREPSTPSTPPPWLSRPLNPSPRSSPLLLQRSSPT